MHVFAKIQPEDYQHHNHHNNTASPPPRGSHSAASTTATTTKMLKLKRVETDMSACCVRNKCDDDILGNRLAMHTQSANSILSAADSNVIRIEDGEVASILDNPI